MIEDLYFKRARVFFFHYNKPISQSTGNPSMSLHVNSTCYIVRSIICNVSTYTYENKTQPRIVIKGKTNWIRLENGVATIE